MFRHGQQLDMRETHVDYVVDQFIREFAVAQVAAVIFRPAPPGAEVYFVNADRPVELRSLGAMLHPLVVRPLVFAREHDGRIARWWFVIVAERVVFQRQQVAVSVEQFELVFLAAADPGDKYLPQPVARVQAHRVAAAVPVVEVADDADARGVRGPDRETRTADALYRAQLRAQLGIDLLVRAFAEQVKIQVAQRSRKAIRVLDIEPVADRRRQPQPVVTQPRRHDGGEDTVGVHAFHLAEHGALVVDDLDALGVRLQRADDA